MDLVFCTNNRHKLQEVASILGSSFSYKTLEDIGYFDEIPEPYETLEENSFIKANQVFQARGIHCFAEDTGLFIDALHGEPGVYSARYAGEPSDSQKNIEKVLEKLRGIENRNAYFKTVITLLWDGHSKQFGGICKGRIALTQSGEKGFGYDPIFIPEGYDKSFAELPADVKNAISHRRKAFDHFADFLKTLSD